MAAPAESLCNDIGQLSEIVLMEDEHNQEIKSALESIGCKVRFVSNRSEAVELAESGKARFFILDIRMGAGPRAAEGLDTLEEIKTVDESICVVIYTVLERYEQEAKNLGADLFLVKSRNKRQDLIQVAATMLPHALAQLDSNSTSPRGDDLDADDPEYSRDFVLNLTAFKKKLEDTDWLAQNIGYYVAFVDGIMVGKEKEKDILLAWLSSNYGSRPRFYMLVCEAQQESVEYLPSSLFVEDV